MKIPVCIGFVVCLFVSGCGNHDSAKTSADNAALQSETGSLLHAITDTENRVAEMLKMYLGLQSLSHGKVGGLAVVEVHFKSVEKQLSDMRKEIYRHSDFETPTVDQIRHGEIDHARLRAKLDEIAKDCRETIAQAMPKPQAEQKWGAVRGRVLISEIPPQREPLVRKGFANVKDSAICSVEGVPDESLIVDSDTLGISNVFIYPRKKPAIVNEALLESSPKEIILDQKGCRFFPHALTWNSAQRIRITSHDNTIHTLKLAVQKSSNQLFGKTTFITPNDETGVVFLPSSDGEKYPVRMTCENHGWMQAIVMIADHPYATITKVDGTFEIPNLPVGEIEFSVWHERVVKRDVKVTVEADKTVEAPTVTISADEFK